LAQAGVPGWDIVSKTTNRSAGVLAPIGQEAQPAAANEPSPAAETITKH
jgi:hypothetical protein